MRVGLYLDSYQPKDGGGYTMQTELFRALCRVNKETKHEFVIISQPDQRIAEESKAAGLGWLPDNRLAFPEKIAEFLARYWPKFRNRFHWRASFERKARDAEIDFIWFLGPRPKTIDLPYLTIVLDLQHRKQPWFPEVSEYSEWETRERLLAPFLMRSAAIIAGTQAGKKEIVQFFQVPENRIHILPHPTPDYIKSISSNSGASHKLPFPSGFLFYPAQFWAHKNHINLLLAIKILANEGLKIPAIFTGSDFGNEKFVKQQISNLGLGEQISVIGFVDQSELISLYQGALALTYVSYFGPENLPPLEAFALGCPVIAANVDGAEEQMKDAALLVNPADPKEIANAIRKIYSDAQLRNDLIARGKIRAAQWTSEDFVRHVFRILDEFEPVRRNWD